NHALELYTDHRLLEELNHCTPEMQSAAVGMVQCILQTVQSFADGAEQADDITMLCLKYQGSV
ncbi:MAG TPA: hypothetical protein P5549_07760, partial [Syntrophomonas sp.]|nr:hypothetical protein [Syntrophomonas sp.]